ncbi:hypothetical protein PLEOSDRAFT_1109054 [Pleurotus ostreatus PC15]|uniref:FHA domain-containing protein n=1 Tax=Pleurotus ostreatus (strain PC15) TaxID=1137138 RepID=A0A067NI41_PLEO1|nr:hypothetical protein PLEOSDRAFT_1109054 [Pleurotus ostreatus PC15]
MVVPTASKVQGVEFISKDATEPNSDAPRKVVLQFPMDGSSVGIPRMFDNNCMSREHGHLELRADGKIILHDNSTFGTFIYWGRGSKTLSKGEHYQVKHGDSIIFGSTKYEPKGSFAVRVVMQVIDNEFLTPPPVAETPSKLTVPKQGHRKNKSDSNLPNAVKHRDDDPKRLSGQHKHLDVQPDNTPIRSRSPSPTAMKKDVASHKVTKLDRELTIPARPGIRLGDGVDVLTGDIMRCALASTASTPLRNSAVPEARGSANIISHETLYTLRSEYGANVGAKINLPCPVDIGADVRSLFARELHKRASIFFVQYQAEGKFPMERLEDPTLKNRLQNMSPSAFRNMYGDYFVDGIINGYRHRIIVACSAKDVSKKKETEHEARVSVANFFQMGGQYAKDTQTSESYNVLDARIELYGYPVATTNLTAGSLEEAREILKGLPTPMGSPTLVLLRHYSLLDYCKLPMEVNIDPAVFKHLQKMRVLYVQLQATMLHPSLVGSYDEYRISNATNEFEEQRTNLAQDSPEALKKRTSILKGLQDAKEAADARVNRWLLVEEAKEMDKIRCFGPDNQRYKWECGSLGKSEAGISGMKFVRMKGGQEAREIDWTTPKTAGSKLGSLIGPPPFQRVKFWSENMKTVIRGHEAVAQTNVSGFSRSTVETRFIVLGWSLSCIWKGKTTPKVIASLPNNCILQDEFEVCVDASVPTEWHCRVTFVEEYH